VQESSPRRMLLLARSGNRRTREAIGTGLERRRRRGAGLRPSVARTMGPP
jgi:hypothetical protein